MNKRFLLTILGVIILGLGLGAFLASITAPPARTAASTAGQALSGQMPIQGQAGGQMPIQGQAGGQMAIQGQAGGRAAPAGPPTGSATQGDAAGRGTVQGARPITGSIVSRDENSLMVSTQQGEVKVSIAEAKIQKTVDGSIEDLKPGSRVTVTGRQTEDGSYSASTIQIIPESDQPASAASGTGTGRSEREATPTPTPVAQQ